ncbi:hypothetical protein EW146_g5494 [Bondarzewia mesenterica]|uniref:Uncharacterized protein n=1 Tax=Bondarzewia mesenterica TaxID=1095465 RepID=A0A4S4LR99_9AGAM|nr:hypothetical protein EW146_g5494 [Bondarzewia mesenterica]
MDQNPLEQEKEIRELIRRAERTPVKNSPQRRDALQRLIATARSPHSSLKTLAASNITKFFKHFPDLDEDAINAIYDLCEDQDSQVVPPPHFNDGYKAIVQVSKEQSRWVKRNADVLAQLLQSDEPDEVIVVKKALLEHLDMDSKVTLGVLCDQLLPTDEPMDDEDKALRDRLRSLVLAFIAGEAKRAIIERHANRAGNEQEQVLVEGLFKALLKPSSSTDATRIVEDILLALPSFKGRHTPRGNELLQILLDHAKVSLKDDLGKAAHSVSLTLSRPYLGLAAFVAVERSVADPIHLLRFCFSTYIPKMTWQRFSESSQLFVVIHLAEALASCSSNANRLTAAEAESLKSLRRQIVDGSSILLPVFVQAKDLDARALKACETLLLACKQRKAESGWSVPSNLTRTLEDLDQLAKSQSTKAGTLEDVIRSLQPTAASIPLKPFPSDTNVGSVAPPNKSPTLSIKRKAEEPLKQMSTSASGALLTIHGQASRRLPIPTRGSIERPRAQPLISFGPSKLSELHPQRAAKRAKKEGRAELETPSLLSRMNPASTAANGSPLRAPEVRPQQQQPPRNAPPFGLSIKGAAKAAEKQSRSSTPPKPSSLLDRMKEKDLAERMDDGEQTAGNRRKKQKRKI